jgi:hypothetical protein
VSGEHEDSARLYLVVGRLVRVLRRSDGGELSPGMFSALATLVSVGAGGAGGVGRLNRAD